MMRILITVMAMVLGFSTLAYGNLIDNGNGRPLGRLPASPAE